jgi:hypothetical protein
MREALRIRSPRASVRALVVGETDLSRDREHDETAFGGEVRRHEKRTTRVAAAVLWSIVNRGIPEPAMKTHALYLVLAGLTGIVACGGSADAGSTSTPAATDPTPAPEQTAEPPAAPPLDHGAVSTTYPAFPSALGQLYNNGGPVLKDPVVVTVTWPGEPNVATFESFGDTIGGSKYWSTVTSEYGVGPGVSGADNHFHMADAAPSSISDTDIEALVKARYSATDATAWPKPATGTPVYIMYLPQSTTLMLQGKSACQQGVGGYHDSVAVAGVNVAYAVIPQCRSNVDDLTLSASHELAEAATDPYPLTNPAWAHFGNDHLAWEFFQQFQSENGDACEFYRDSDMGPTADMPFVVQRQWSNASASAGHNPCVPAAPGAYFNVAPLKTEDVDLDLSALGGGVAFTKGYTVSIGETKQIALGLYSDAATTGPWKIKAVEGGIGGGHGQSSGTFDLSLDLDQGENGQIAYLTVTTLSEGRVGGGLVTIVSTMGNTTHYQPIMIGTPAAKK